MTSELDLKLPEAIGQAEDLPSPPGVIVEILRLTKDEAAGVADFVRVISGDPALAAKLIKTSNSPMFSTGAEVTTLDRACMLLGLKTVQLMALSFSLSSLAPSTGDETGFSLKEYWARCLITAVAARTFSKQLGYRLDDEAFLCGLLSLIGQLAILQCMPDAYRSILEHSGSGWPSRETEQEVLGFDRSFVGAALLRSWGLPALIYRSITSASHLDPLPEDADDELRRLVDLLRAAELTAEVLRGESRGEALRALRGVAESAGLAESDLDAVLDGLEVEIEEAADLLDVELAPGASHTEILDDARHQGMRIGLGAAAELIHAEQRVHNLSIENRDLARKASRDELTGIPNRAGFDTILAAELEAQIQGARPESLGLLMIDADHFKQFNDAYGHRAGDEILRTIGRILKETTRTSDVPARYGGEEFAVISPGITPEGLETQAERLREAIEAAAIDHEGTQLEVTVSIGGACLSEARDQGDGARLLEAADQQLYEAKQGGRNRCAIAQELLRLA